jgi:uncharacterized damage-inducible protein DinB
MVPAEALSHLRYSGWASRKLMDAARSLPSEDLHKPLGVSHNSIAQTLGHIYLADRIWCWRVVDPTLTDIGLPLSQWAETAWNLAETGWPEIQKKWEDWAASLDDAGLARVVTYKGMDGKTFENEAYKLVLHVVNHATLHRGQVMAMLRQVGVKPPATDLLFYYREPK